MEDQRQFMFGILVALFNIDIKDIVFEVLIIIEFPQLLN